MDYLIAIVDDDTDSLKTARFMLSESGMKVNCLCSGKDLLKYMKKNNPDIILMDIIMPEMDGFAAFCALRKQCEDDGKSVPPVIFLTGESDSSIERRGLSAGASDFVYKPFNRDILVSRILHTVENKTETISYSNE